MKKTITTIFALLCLQLSFAQTTRLATGSVAENNSDIQKLLKSYEKKIYFTQNQGQFNPAVLYRADFPLGQAVVTKEGIIVSTYDPEMMSARQEEGEQVERDIQNGKLWRPISGRMKGHSWRMNFINSSSSMTIEGKQHHSDVYNYFTGGTKLNSVNNFGEIWYNNVYDNVDVRYYPSAEGTLEYDIVCKPGFNNKNISVKFDGIEKMDVLENGHLVLHTSVGDVDFPAPVAYQKMDGVEKGVTARYTVSGNKISFQLGEYDVNQPVIIDPIALRWATWVNTNSSGDNHGHCIWVDQNDGAIYVVARVVGTTDQITVGAFDVSANGNLETIIGKYLEPAAIGGSGTRVWQTYIGGSGDENPYAMEQGPDSNLYITGYTSSTDFPLIGGSAFGGTSIDHRTQTTDNIFIMKITRDGQSIKSSVIGGNGDDGSFDLRINTNGDIVICGNTQSTNLLTQLPGSGAVNANNGNIDGIVFKINSDLSAVSWVKNYGGSGIDQPTIMVQNNSTGEIYVGGYTTSTNFPTTNPRQATRNGSQAGFLQKLNSSGTTLWSSYFQSASGSSASILCMEFNTTKDQLYFGGITSGLVAANIGHVGVYDSTYNAGTNDFFVCRMDTNQNYVACTYLGGSANEVNMMGLNTDLNNDVYVFGYTNSTNFPVSALPNTPLQTTNLGQNDKVFLKLNSTLSTLLFSTYYGGSNDDYDPVGERGIKFSNCRIYTIVTSISNNIPLTVGALNTSRISTTPYEPGLVVWANPPDLVNNTINDDQTICAGATPQDITGSVPNYSLPTITRNGTTSTYPALASAATYQWQMSTDSVNWSPMGGQTGQNLSGAAIGPLFVKTFFRRIIGGDACILAGAADQVVTVKIITVTGTVNNVLCDGTGSGSITANSDGQAPFLYVWSNGQTTQQATNLTTGTYTVTVTDDGNCTASASFSITVNPSPATPTITGSGSVCSGSSTQWCAPSGLSGYLWNTGATTQCITVSNANTFTVTVTNTYGCTASSSKTLTVNPLPTCSITGSNFCYGYSSQLCAATNSGYLWSTGATTQCITVTVGGTYTVTVSSGSGCTSSCSKTVIAYTPPTCAITGTFFYCQGSSTQICAPAGLVYIWNTGATTQCITTTAGDYTVTVTDANGCTNSCSANVTQRPTPNCSITGSSSVCQGGSAQWCAAAAPVGYTYSYLWSTAATTQCVTVNTASTYTVTVTDQYGCTSSCSKSLTVNPLPTCSITGSNFCYGYSSQLCAATNSGYLWSTGATTQCITVTVGGTYTVTVSSGSGCTSSCSKTVIAYTPPTCAITGTFFYCQGSSTQICAPAGLVYIWNTGATTQCITTTAGDYTVTVTDANGCTNSCSANVTQRPTPNCSITGSSSVCQGGSAQWCAAAAPVGYTYSYLWSTAATTQCVTVNTASTYTVTVTDQYGCTSSCSKSLTVNPLPTCSITGSNFCYGYSSQLCAATNSGYLWSTGATTQCITVTVGGTYTVTVSSGSGCTSSCSKTVIAYTPPTCAITGTFFYCQGSSTQICAPAGLVYIWNTGATTQCITTTAGDYTVTVTDANGCTNSCSANVTQRPTPNCSITGSSSVCQGGSAQWCAAAAPVGYTYSYLWSTAATTQCVTVNTASTYTVTVTDQYGCTSSCSKSLTVNPLPTCSITGSNFCYGYSSQLCAATNSGYLWSTGATTQCITVTVGGTYTVTVSSGSGCTSSCSKTVIAYTPPTCAITGTFFYCQGSSTQICAPAGLVYIWNTGATTQCITTTAGDYTVTVTDANGCTNSCSANVTQRPTPNCSITGSSSVCQGGSAQWCAAAAPVGYTYSYLWSTAATTQCVTVNTASTYTVTVTDQYGCTSSCSKSLTVNPLPTCSITGSNFCYGYSSQLCAATNSGYLWSTGATTQCITVTVGGTYTVTVSSGSGCTSSCSKTVIAYTPPTCAITGTFFYCQGSSTQICAPAGLVYIWNTGATTQCITTTAGDYTVTVTDANGCTNSCSANVTQRPTPNCSITGSSSVCQGGSAQWCAAAAPVGYTYSYLWSTAATTQCVTVNTASTYTVTVTDQYGCTSSCSKSLTVNPLPTCSITGSNFCYGYSSQLCAATNSGYLWSTGATTQCITVTVGGTYTVTVSSGSGCTSSCSKTVIAYTPPTCAITGTFFYCQGSSTQICAPAGLVYIWNTGATTQCITTTAGDYTVTVTDANGCTNSCSANVTQRPTPNCSITGSSSVCQGGSAQWCAAAAPVGYTYSYLWSTAATTQCVTVNTASTYTVTVTDQYGCTSSCSKSLTVNPLPTCSITGSNFCYGYSSQLCAATNSGYLWSTGATTQCITVTVGGTYTVTVSSGSGCTSSCSKTVIAYTPPTCAITGTFFYCQGSSTQICAPAGLVYIWNTGATTQCITTTAGDYTVTVTDANGCTNSCSANVTQRPTPNCSITGSSSVCQGGSAQWCAAAAPVGYTYSYLWSTAATTQCVTVNTASTYTVTVTDQYGCTSSCSKSLTVNQAATCTITGSANVCSGNSTQWCAATGQASYLWSTGATTQCITVSTAGTYTVTTTNNAGCISTCNKTLTVRNHPSCLITGTASVCPGGSTQWCAPSGLSAYLWSTGATTQCITVSSAGTYTVTTTNNFGCTSNCNKTLTIKNAPSCLITGSNSVCQGNSTQWCAPSGLAAYLWSTGATTQCITVGTAGTYTVTTTNGSGCTNSCNKTLIVNTNNVTITSTGPTTYCDYDPNMMLCASAGVAYIWDTGETTQCVPANDKTHLYVVTVTDGNGCVGTASQQVIENLLPDVIINTPSSLPICGLTGNILTGSTDPGNSYSWTVSSSDNSWVINGSTTSSSISYKAGNPGVCGEFFLTATIPATGCKKTVSMIVCSNCEEHCGYAQSFYGSATGLSCDGLTKTQLITNLLPNTLVSGDALRTVSILSSEVSCLIDKMPSKTNASALPVGNVTCATALGTAYLNNGQFKHALLGEAIALGLNVRLDPSLSNLVMSGPYMTTYKANNCTGGKAVNGTKLVFAIPQSVLNYISSPKTVGKLLLLANQALGATYVPSGSNPTIAEIDSACKAINTGFDKCRILAGFGTSSAGVRSQDQLQQLQLESSIQVNAYPNPFSSTATIEFISSDKASHATVQVFSLAGDKVANLFEGDVEAGAVYEVKFDARNLGEGIYIYRIISGDNIINGKLILIK